MAKKAIMVMFVVAFTMLGGWYYFPVQNRDGAAKLLAQDNRQKPGIIDITNYIAAPNQDCTAALQMAVNDALRLGCPVYMPAGKYKVSATISYKTTGDTQGLRLFGDGMLSTVIQYTGTGPFLTLDGSGKDNTFQHGGELRDLGVIGGGVLLRSNWHLTMQRVQISDAPGDAVLIINSNAQPNLASDADGSCLLTFHDCRFIRNGGCGIRVALKNGPGSVGQVIVENCFIVNNQGQGIRFFGAPLIIRSCAIAQNWSGGILFGFRDTTTDPDVYATRSNGHQQHSLDVGLNELDSNGQYGLYVEAALGGVSIIGNRFAAQDYTGIPPQAPVLCKLGMDDRANGFLAGVDCSRNIMKAGGPKTVAFIVSPGCLGARLIDNTYPGFAAPKERRYQDRGTNTLILEYGKPPQ